MKRPQRAVRALQAVLDGVLDGTRAEASCQCTTETHDRTLAVDARDCAGRPGTTRTCRATAARALAGSDADRFRVRTAGAYRFHGEDAVALLRAAARFADLVREEAPRLAEAALRDPASAARAAAARASPVDDVAAETGLIEAAGRVAAPFEPEVAPVIGDARVDATPPRDAHLRECRELPGGATARIYDAPDSGAAVYHLEPVEVGLEEADLRTLAEARDLLAAHRRSRTAATPAEAIRRAGVGGEAGAGTAAAVSGTAEAASGTGAAAPGTAEAAPGTAEAASGTGAAAPDAGAADVRTLASVLEKHTAGYGVLEDCFADPAVSDVYASGPAARTPLWVVADGEAMRTNLTLTRDGAAALASRLRRASGRSFSRASPTIDATATIAGERVRAAGVLEPATEGHAFAFRTGGERAFTLPALVANGTLTAEAAGLLSVAVRRSATCLVAGPRGAGKTTLLSALLWELPATRRLVVVEDTPELPVSTLQELGRDAQPLRTSLRDGPGVDPAEALRTALRLGESALVVGEVRGEEASVLFEAMRVGAGGETVLGTIHGEGAAGVRERVVAELGVSPASFAATDLVVTCERAAGEADRAGSAPGDSSGARAGERRRVATVEECRDWTAGPGRGATDGGGGRAGLAERGGSAVRFASLYEQNDSGLASTDRTARGNSDLLHDLARPGESYASVLEAVRRRGELLGRLAGRGTTAPADVTTAYARSGGGPC